MQVAEIWLCFITLSGDTEEEVGVSTLLYVGTTVLTKTIISEFWSLNAVDDAKTLKFLCKGEIYGFVIRFIYSFVRSFIHSFQIPFTSVGCRAVLTNRNLQREKHTNLFLTIFI